MRWNLLVVLCFVFVTKVAAVGPTIDNLTPSGAGTISEDVTTEDSIITLTITDADSAANDIFCSLGTGSTPTPAATTNSLFRVRQNGGTDWIVYTVAGSTYDYNTVNTYSLDVECEDETSTVGEGVLIVSLTQNQAPVISNIAAGTSVNLPTTSTIGTTVFTVASTDAEGNQIYYDITCSPTPCPFAIYASGHLQLTADISDTTTASYGVTVTPSDDTNTGTPQTLTVAITGINNAPIQGTIANFNVAENTGPTVSQVTPACTDVDGDTLSYFMACTPSSGLTYFQIVTSTGVISTSSTSSINYEQLNAAGTTSFACSLTCSDGKKTDTDSFTITITDVNEAPAFEQNGYAVSVDEGAGGTQIQSSGYTVIDPDTGDTASFSMNCGTYDSYFTIDSTTGIASFAGPYDADDASRPASVTCTVTVTDSGTLTESVSLNIEIRNINDNTPIFAASTYFWFVSYGAPTSTTAGNVLATDGDTGTFGILTYSLDQTSLTPTGTYFGISNTGEVYVASALTPLTEGTTVTMKAIATDSGSLSSTADISIVLVGTTTTTTTTTTDRYQVFFEDPRNVTWFSLCMAALIAIFLLLGGFIIKNLYDNFNGKGCCKIRRRKWKNWAANHELEEDPFEPEPETYRQPSPEPLVPTIKPRPAGDEFKFWSAYS